MTSATPSTRAVARTRTRDLQAAIDAEPKAGRMLSALSARNRFALAFRMHDTKTAAGRKKKIATFVDMLERGETIHPQGKRSSSRRRRRGPRDRLDGLRPRRERRAPACSGTRSSRMKSDETNGSSARGPLEPT